MEINKRDLNLMIKRAIRENVFEIDPEDTDMQQKVAKLKGDTSLYNDAEDEIKIGDSTNESSYSKSEVLNLMAEAKKKKNINDDYLSAIQKADRELDYELNGPGWKAKDRAHKDKKQYDRKRDGKGTLNDCVTESVLSKIDIVNMILEKKYNGKLYSKSELMKSINQ